MTPTVAILAGGLATRLRSLTEKQPKALLDVGGQPFISRQLDLLRDRGVTDVVLCLGWLGEQVEAVVGDGAAWGLRVQYSWDGDPLMGTGGAIRKALPLLGDTFFILYGDSYLDIEYRPIADFFLCGDDPGLMTVYHNTGRYDSSNVLYRDGRILAYDKTGQASGMEHIDYGLAILRATSLADRPLNQKFDIAEVYGDLVRSGRMMAWEVNRRFYEIGSLEGLADLRRHLAGEQESRV